CIRRISKADARAHSLPLFKNLKILPFKALYYFRCLCIIKKHFNSLDIRLNSSNRRNSYYVHNYRYRTTHGQNSLNYRSLSLLNFLNSDITQKSKEQLKQIALEIFLSQ